MLVILDRRSRITQLNAWPTSIKRPDSANLTIKTPFAKARYTTRVVWRQRKGFTFPDETARSYVGTFNREASLNKLSRRLAADADAYGAE